MCLNLTSIVPGLKFKTTGVDTALLRGLVKLAVMEMGVETQYVDIALEVVSDLARALL